MKRILRSSAAAGAILAAVVAGVIAGTSPSWLPLGESSRTVPAEQIRPGLMAVELPTATPIYDLAYDAATDSLWYAASDPFLPDRLVQYVVNTGKQSEWVLPDTDYNGYLSQVKIGAAGTIWLTQPYRLVRFDPRTETVESVEYPLDAPDALPGADDPNHPSPGTWISSIAFSGDEVLVARNNVAAISRIGQNLIEVDRLPVPEAYAGALDMAVAESGEIFLVPGYTETADIAVRRVDGSIAPLGVEGQRLTEMGGGVFASGGSAGGSVIDVRGGATGLLPSATGIDSRAALHPDGGAIVYDPSSRSIRHVLEGSVIAEYALGAGDLVDHNPLTGEGVVATLAPAIHDLVVDSQGRTWFIDGHRQAILGLDL